MRGGPGHLYPEDSNAEVRMERIRDVHNLVNSHYMHLQQDADQSNRETYHELLGEIS